MSARRRKDPISTARQLYVTGAAASLEAAATAAKAPIERVRAAALEQGWQAETEAFARLEEERTRLNAKTVGWRAIAAGMRSIELRINAASGDKAAKGALQKLRKGGDKHALPLHVTPAGLKALAHVAKMLREEGERQPRRPEPGPERTAELATAVDELLDGGERAEEP